MQYKGKYVVYDVETADSANSYICSIGFAIVNDGEIESTCHTLVKPNCEFGKTNIKIHGITKDTVVDAPAFPEIWNKFCNIFENAIMVAHNANFDLSVIKKELIRHNIQLDRITYVDTLQVAKKCLNLEHYGLSDVCKALNIKLESHHCALDDCVATANILIKLLDEYDISLNDFIRKFSVSDKYDELMGKRKSKSSIYIGVDLPSKYLKVDFFNNCPQIIDLQGTTVCLSGDFESMSKSEFASILECKGAIVKKGVTMSLEYLIIGEQGSERWAHGCFGTKVEKTLRYNSNGSNILIVREKEFLKYSNMLGKKPVRSVPENISYVVPEDDWHKCEGVVEKCDSITETSNETKEIVENSLKDIKCLDIDINPINNRVPLNEIRNLENWDKGFDEGLCYWEQGEQIRKSGDIQTAIKLFDKARYNGYCAPALFESYAIAYRKLKDYDNEIDILNEGIQREKKCGTNVSKLEVRRDKAIQLLYKQQEEKQEKVRKKAKVITESPKKFNVRAILQLSDDMTIIRRYETVAEAVRETGINSKSIRDAAKGVQKHAGGFVWKYADDRD